MATQLYPRVQITTQALQRRRAAVARSNATRLLVPFISSKGPENEIVEIDSLSDFTEMYGGLSYTTPGQEQILNIGKWLAGGGIVCACRITNTLVRGEDDEEDENANKTKFSKLKYASTHSGDITGDGSTEPTEITGFKFGAVAKYSGKYYNDLSVSIDFNANGTFNINVGYKVANSSKYTTIEKYNNLTIDTIYKFINASQYIGELTVEYPAGYDSDDWATYAKYTITATQGTEPNDEGKDIEYSDYESRLTEVLNLVLAPRLTTQIDCFIDCGYSKETKNKLAVLFGAVIKDNSASTITTRRTDIFAIFTTFVLDYANGKGTGKHSSENTIVYNLFRDEVFNVDEETYNIAVYDLYAKVIDNYSSLKSGNEVEVPITYFLAELIPFIDAQYGIQYAPAGKQRTLLGNELLWVSANLSATEKENHYRAGINYIERDQDGYCFMTQLTFTQQDTTLKFINHERTLLKIQKDLEVIGRNYIHEINDAITKKNLTNQLNSYINNWISNRTLRNDTALAVYDANENETLENQELLIALDLIFNRTVEIISVEITCSE